MKYGPQQHQYHQHHMVAHRHTLPNPGYESQFRFSYNPHHQQHQQHQHHYGSQVEYYRQHTQTNGYHQHQLQGQGSMNAAVSVSLPSSPNHGSGRFTQLHHPNSWMTVDEIKSPPE
jgi:hypothetical protein